MTLKELKNTVVNTKTQEEYDELMKIYEDGGWEWNYKIKPTAMSSWSLHKADTCVRVQNRFGHADKDWYEDEGCKIITLEEFKKEQGIMKYKVGDILRDNSCVRQYIKILGVCGEAYMASDTGTTFNSGRLMQGGGIYTESELDELSYELYTPEPEIETIEIDGKKYNKSEVSERLKELKEITE